MATVPEFMKMLQVLQVNLGATNLEFEQCDRSPDDGGPYGRVTGNIPEDGATETKARDAFLNVFPAGSCEVYYGGDDLLLFELEWTT